MHFLVFYINHDYQLNCFQSKNKYNQNSIKMTPFYHHKINKTVSKLNKFEENNITPDSVMKFKFLVCDLKCI